MRRCLERLRISCSLSRNVLHDLNEAVKRLLRLSLSRLDHDSLMEEQREIDCRRMETIIQQSLGYIESSDTGRFVLQSVKYELMLADRRYRKFKAILKRLLYIVSTENRKRTHHLHILLSEHEDICVRTEKDSEITHES